MNKTTNFQLNDLEIMPNYGQWDYSNQNISDLIYLGREDEVIDFSLDEAKFIVKTLTQIIDYYDNPPTPKKGDEVRFVKGRMNGLKGTIVDIDLSEVPPIVVKIEPTNEISNCFYYCGYDDIELLKD